MLGADARIVEARRNRMRLANLPQLVLQQVGLVAVQNADAACSDRGRMMGSADAETRGLDANQLDVGVFDKRIEKSDRVRAAVDACNQYVGQAPFLLENLAARLTPDDRLEVAHDHRVRMRPRGRANQV